MGKEATCQVQWANESAECKVLMEAHELIVRGPIRRKVNVASITRVEVNGKHLQFQASDQQVALALGEATAQSWARKLTTPPPTLAAKLGITSSSKLTLIGEFTSSELALAVASATSTDSTPPDLVLANIRSADDLNYALDLYNALKSHPPIWIIYPKKSSETGVSPRIDETTIRSILRREGLMDTKVASVSTTLTALRFMKKQTK